MLTQKCPPKQRDLFNQNKELRHSAITDPLTGLLNVSTLNSRLTDIIDDYKRHKAHESAILFIDIDSFKALNDNYGHPKGDELLIKIADAFKENKRPLDIAFRPGGR